jgi:hypothetical protein
MSKPRTREVPPPMMSKEPAMTTNNAKEHP